MLVPIEAAQGFTWVLGFSRAHWRHFNTQAKDMCASPARDYSYDPEVVHDVVLTGLVRNRLAAMSTCSTRQHVSIAIVLGHDGYTPHLHTGTCTGNAAELEAYLTPPRLA